MPRHRSGLREASFGAPAGLSPRERAELSSGELAARAGVTNDTLGRILRTRDAGGAPCREVRRLAGEKVESLRRDVERLTGLRADLEEVVADWDRRLAAAGAGRRAGLLEALLERSHRRQAGRNAERRDLPSLLPRPR